MWTAYIHRCTRDTTPFVSITLSYVRIAYTRHSLRCNFRYGLIHLASKWKSRTFFTWIFVWVSAIVHVFCPLMCYIERESFDHPTKMDFFVGRWLLLFIRDECIINAKMILSACASPMWIRCTCKLYYNTLSIWVEVCNRSQTQKAFVWIYYLQVTSSPVTFTYRDKLLIRGKAWTSLAPCVHRS